MCYHEKALDFVKCLFCFSGRDSTLVLYSVKVYWVDRMSYVEPNLHSWDKSHLVKVSNHFYMLLEFSLPDFVRDFCIRLHKGYWSIVLYCWCLALISV